MGPLVSAAQRDRVSAIVQRAVRDGAHIATGGRAPAEPSRGWFFEPTVLVGVDNRSEIAREEIFGPVVTVIPYDDERHAVELAERLARTAWVVRSTRPTPNTAWPWRAGSRRGRSA